MTGYKKAPSQLLPFQISISQALRKIFSVLHFRVLAGLVIGLTLAACVASTPYESASRTGYGYSDQRIESDRYRVTFRGNAATSRETVENYLLLRSAEITLENGYDYFIVVENDTEARSYYSSLYGSSFHGGFHNGFGPFYGGGGFGRRGFRGGFGRFGAFPYYPYGFGYGADYYGGSYRENTQYSAIAFIALFKGEKPKNESAAFNAREVADNLRPLVQQDQS